MLQVDWKPQRVTDLIAHLRSVVHQQYEELRRLLAGLGDFQLTPLFAPRHLTTQMRWNGISTTAKGKAFTKFMADTGIVYSPQNAKARPTVERECSVHCADLHFSSLCVCLFLHTAMNITLFCRHDTG